MQLGVRLGEPQRTQTIKATRIISGGGYTAKRLRVPDPRSGQERAVNAPHSRRFAKFEDTQPSRTVWSAVALARLSEDGRGKKFKHESRCGR
jgi:hypothetical protein